MKSGSVSAGVVTASPTPPGAGSDASSSFPKRLVFSIPASTRSLTLTISPHLTFDKSETTMPSKEYPVTLGSGL